MKADLHVHTCYSIDGESTPEQLVEFATKVGIGCIAITDHNNFDAFDIIKDSKKIIVIPGEEVSSLEGHIIALGINKLIPKGLSIQDTIERIHEAGGYAFAAHPFRWWSGIGKANAIKYNFDGIEARNGRSIPSANIKSEKLAENIGKPISAGSDAHSPIYIGSGYIMIPDTIKTWQDAISAIMSDTHRTPFSCSRNIKETLEYGIKSILRWILRGFRKI